MVEQFFKEVTEIPEVEAVVVFDNKQNMIGSWSTTRYNPSIFSEIGESFLHIFGTLEHLRYDLNEVVVPFDKGLLYARTHPKFYLVVLSKQTVEVPLIRLAVNVCLGELEENRKAKKTFKKLSDKKFYQIKSITLDDNEKILLEKMLEESDGAK